MNNQEINYYINKYKNGDNEAFSLIYQDTYKLVYNTIFRIINNSSCTDDLVQETYIKAYSKIDTYKENNFYGWITTIARNLALNYMKQIQKEVAIDPYENEHLFVYSNENKRMVNEAYDLLDGDEKKLFYYLIIKGYSVKDAAKEFKTDLNKIYYLRKKMYATLKK